MASYILQEDGFKILQEDGSGILLENQIITNVGAFSLTGISINISKGWKPLVASVGAFILSGINTIITQI